MEEGAVEKGTMERFTVHHDGVTLPVTRGGRGRPLVLCPGLSSTQADLHDLAAELRHDFDVTTFDLRGHGLASAAGSYSFEAFGSDLAAVLAELARRGLPAATPPLLVGYSLGADLVLQYAAEHPDTVPLAGLVLIDGANPVPDPFLTPTDLPLFRTMWEEQANSEEVARAKGTPRQVLLTGQEILDLNLEVDAVRTQQTLDRHGKIRYPIRMIMSTSMAGDSAEDPVPRFNQLWRDGIDRLLRARPQTPVTRLDTDHGLVFTHAREIADIIRTSTP
ncbi:alpha/beta fold hydrolase [Streptomyces sp. NPDC059009]|uniref:alpha/beta fold hydrolase n=1 Tax=Streptomyces sp. NPDC059009 TaxID=3346694 RepID=UPI00369D11A6